MNITLDSDSRKLTMQSSTKAQINASITISGTGTSLPITIIGEFKDIPPNLHGMYIQALQGSYGSVNVYDRTKDDEPKTIEEKKREWRLNRITDILCKALKKNKN